MWFPADINEKEFIIAMDNYFTLPKVIAALREKKIGVVGTSRFKRNWPPKKLKNIDADKADFNQFYWCVDEYGTLLGRWVDNNFVFCVSTIHCVGRSIQRLRRKPRKTLRNTKHVERIWGNEGAVLIDIPVIIDDYNHWMGGVDLADQRIAYYHPDLCCYRNWFPCLFRCFP